MGVVFGFGREAVVWEGRRSHGVAGVGAGVDIGDIGAGVDCDAFRRADISPELII